MKTYWSKRDIRVFLYKLYCELNPDLDFYFNEYGGEENIIIDVLSSNNESCIIQRAPHQKTLYLKTDKIYIPLNMSRDLTDYEYEQLFTKIQIQNIDEDYLKDKLSKIILSKIKKRTSFRKKEDVPYDEIHILLSEIETKIIKIKELMERGEN